MKEETIHRVKVRASSSSAKSHIIKPDSFCVAETPLLFSPQCCRGQRGTNKPKDTDCLVEDVRVLMCRCEYWCIILTPLQRQMIEASKITDAVLADNATKGIQQLGQTELDSPINYIE